MGAVANLLALGGAAEDYARWGYPRRYNFVPGSLELATALLLLRGRTRVWGAVLGALIMACAGATVLLNGEPGRVLAPSIVLAMCVLAGLLHDGARTVGSVQEEARP